MHALAAAALLVAADADRALDVLKAHCHRCHGRDGSLEGGLNYVLDPAKLAARGKLVPGDPDRSPLLRRVERGQMPPADVAARPTAADVKALRDWVAAGAKADTTPTVKPVPAADVTAAILADLETADRRARRFYRYFTLAHLHNAGLGPDELQTYRAALAKLLNSLSWHPQLAIPRPVDAAGLVLRIDLRDLLWDANLWNRLLAEYPYGVLDSRAASRAAMAATATRVPAVRADWFVAAASRPPLYYDLLQVPGNVAELERQLRVDAVTDIRQERVARVGFNGSGVARNNRLLERHPAAHGAYWRTYDFDAVPQNLADRGLLTPDPRNLFAFPLGPAGAGGPAEPFRHAGGEAIFSLPNGMHGYMLMNAAGDRIDRAPAEVVSDPRRPDRAVEAGVSCMGCHVTGILPKADQVRPFLDANPHALPRPAAELARALYPPAEATAQLMEDDAARYRAAAARCGVRPGKTEPVSTLTLRYEADLDLPTAAAEAGVAPGELLRRLASADAARNLGPLRSGGTVGRAVFVQAFADLAAGELFRPTGTEPLPDATGDADPLEGPPSRVNAAVVTPDGGTAVFAGADRSARLWDVGAGRERKALVGHTASVWAAALSPDAGRVATASADGTVRLWDAATGEELRRLDAHLGPASAVAFSPDGTRLLTAGHDHAVVLWDADSGRELRRWDGRAKFPAAVAFSADGARVLVGAGRALLAWPAAGGDAARCEGHADSVTAVVPLPGGRALTASDDGTARVWDVNTGKCVHTLTGHGGPVTAAAAGGRRLATGSADRAVRVWDADTGTLLATHRGHAAAVVGVAFAGRQVVSVGGDTEVRAWDAGQEPKNPRTQGTPPPGSLSPWVLARPAAARPLDGVAAALAPSADGRHLYALNRTAGLLSRFDAATLAPAGELAVPAEAFALSPNGRHLAAAGGDKLWLIDPAAWRAGDPVRLRGRAYDVAVRDDGTAFVSEAAADWAEVTVIARGAVAARWAGAWGRSALRLSADGRRLYVAPQGVTPGTAEAWPLPADLAARPTPRAAEVPPTHPLGGEPTMTPDGRFLMWPTGTVLALSDRAGDDLKPAAKLAPFASAAADPAAGLAVAAGDDGVVRVYDYPSFRERSSFRPAGSAYRVAVAGRRLWLAAFDPAALRDRPRAAVPGELRAYVAPGP